MRVHFRIATILLLGAAACSQADRQPLAPIAPAQSVTDTTHATTSGTPVDSGGCPTGFYRDPDSGTCKSGILGGGGG